jgi:hypothetical protein
MIFDNSGIYKFFGGSKNTEPQRRNAAMQHTKENKKDINKPPLCPLRLCGSIVLYVLKDTKRFLMITYMYFF